MFLLYINNIWYVFPRWFRRVIIITLSSFLAMIGLILLVLPGPGFLFLLASLSILAVEFAWAAHIIDRLHKKGEIASKNFFNIIKTKPFKSEK